MFLGVLDIVKWVSALGGKYLLPKSTIFKIDVALPDVNNTVEPPWLV